MRGMRQYLLIFLVIVGILLSQRVNAVSAQNCSDVNTCGSGCSVGKHCQSETVCKDDSCGGCAAGTITRKKCVADSSAQPTPTPTSTCWGYNYFDHPASGTTFTYGQSYTLDGWGRICSGPAGQGVRHRVDIHRCDAGTWNNCAKVAGHISSTNRPDTAGYCNSGTPNSNGWATTWTPQIPGGNYTLRAAVINDPSTSCVQWSEKNITIACPALGAPTALSVSCSSDKTSATISWNRATNATFYSTRLDKNPNSFSRNCSTLNAGDSCSDPRINRTTVRGLTPNTQYRFWVHGRTDCNLNAWSSAPAVNFSCDLPTPTRQPDINVVDTTVPGNLLTNEINGDGSSHKGKCDFGKWCWWSRNATSKASIIPSGALQISSTAQNQNYGSCWIQWVKGATADSSTYRLVADVDSDFKSKNPFIQIETKNITNYITPFNSINGQGRLQWEGSVHNHNEWFSVKFCSWDKGTENSRGVLKKVSLVKVQNTPTPTNTPIPPTATFTPRPTNAPPKVSNVAHSPSSPVSGGKVTVSAIAIDPDGNYPLTGQVDYQKPDKTWFITSMNVTKQTNGTYKLTTTNDLTTHGAYTYKVGVKDSKGKRTIVTKKFTAVVPTKAPTNTPTNTPTPTPFHSVCVNNACRQVAGAGENTCSIDRECAPPTNTPVPSATNTPIPPANTNTPIPPTATLTPRPTNTPIPPTATNTLIPTIAPNDCPDYEKGNANCNYVEENGVRVGVIDVNDYVCWYNEYVLEAHVPEGGTIGDCRTANFDSSADGVSILDYAIWQINFIKTHAQDGS